MENEEIFGLVELFGEEFLEEISERCWEILIKAGLAYAYNEKNDGSSGFLEVNIMDEGNVVPIILMVRTGLIVFFGSSVTITHKGIKLLRDDSLR